MSATQRDSIERQRMIGAGILHPRTNTEITRYRGTLGPVTVALDAAGRREAELNIARGRKGNLDHALFVPEQVWSTHNGN